MIAAVYDEKGIMRGVKLVQDTAVAGDKKTLNTVVTLPSKLASGYKIKVFLVKDITSIEPIREAEEIQVD